MTPQEIEFVKANFPKFWALCTLFPRWKYTRELALLAEDKLRGFTREQVSLAAGQHRLERKGDDPDLGALVNRLKGTGTRHAVQFKDAKQLLEEYNNRPYTAEERAWDALCDSWRSDLRQCMRHPTFNANEWARNAFRLFASDCAKFGHTSISFVTAYLVRIGRDCGVKIEVKNNPEAKALVGIVNGGDTNA